MPDTNSFYPETEAAAPPMDDTEETPESKTALLPKSMLGEVAVGQTVTLKVISLYEDEVEVGPADAKTDKESAHKSAMDTAMSSMDEMAMD